MPEDNNIADNSKALGSSLNSQMLREALLAASAFSQVSESAAIAANQIIMQQQCAQELREALLASAFSLAKNYQAIIEVTAPSIEAALASFSSQISSIEPILENLRKFLEKSAYLEPHMEGAILFLGNYGWYFDPEMIRFHDLVEGYLDSPKSLSVDQRKELDDLCVEHFESRSEEIEKFISKKFPHRAHIIQAAFRAHQRGEYILSIPVFMSQTDGICQDILSECLFMSKEKKPATASPIIEKANTSNPYVKALLSPLLEKLPINYSPNERGKDFNGLNRHLVLHGESLDYGSKINSNKSISLIYYIANFLTDDQILATTTDP